MRKKGQIFYSTRKMVNSIYTVTICKIDIYKNLTNYFD